MFSASTKRSFSDPLPTPEELARALKRNKTGPVPAQGLARQQAQPLSRLTSGIPANALPILEPPYTVSDFFIDLKQDLEPPLQKQFQESVRTHPPPAQPVLFGVDSDKTGPGVMVPFVYPPFPSIAIDPWTNAPEDLGSRPNHTTVYPTMAPLPFPPSSYMPYPIVANDGLAPKEIFDMWLDASGRLPRIDMVVASAAGSIFDMRAHAEASGLDRAKLDEIVRLGQMVDSDPEASDDRSSVASAEESESRYERYMDYINGIDVSETHDPYIVDRAENTVVVEPAIKAEYTNVRPQTTKDGQLLPPGKPDFGDISTAGLVGERAPAPKFEQDDDGKDVVNALGMHKEKRREALLEKVNNIEEFAAQNREQLFLAKKNQLLERLKLLRESKVHFDPAKDTDGDEDLDRYKSVRQTQNDEELLRLKHAHSFEKLKAILNFIQTSNRSYKTMNAVMINKLQKLKNFLSYQHNLFKEALNSKASGDSDLLSIRNRDSAKIFNGFVDLDFSSEIKEEFRAAHAQEDGMMKESAEKFEPSLFRKVYTNWQHDANVNDYMPLVTREEFLMITGEAPNKTGPVKDSNNKAKSARHQIFQSPLYDRVTSGSDTANFDPAVPVKRRPGRRAAPKPTYGEEVSKQSNETALVAKIMKQFVGPGGASADELSNDFQSIGIESRWPMK